MSFWVDALIVLVVLTNLRALGTSRLGACVRTVAVQGALLGLLPLIAHAGDLTLRLCLQAAASTLLKAVVFPWLLGRAVREAAEQREGDPFVGPMGSLSAGLLFWGGSYWLGNRLPAPGAEELSLLVPTALFTIFVGLFLIVARRKALMQVLGYLVLENGIFTFGMAFAEKQPLLVELGILLDVFMGVFVMGLTLYHISRELEHLDADRLSELRD